MTQHTPTPWSVGRTSIPGESLVHIGRRGLTPGSRSIYMRTEDAEFIVQACNAYDDMVDALVASKRLFDEALPKLSWGGSVATANVINLLNEVPDKVATAIAKAKKGAP